MPWLVVKRTVLVISLLGTFAAGVWFGMRYSHVRDQAIECTSESRFAQLEWMLLAYHGEHGSFPPTKYQQGVDEPFHSWRVLLLPYIDMYYARAYSRYDFRREWNSADNVAALSTVGNRYSVDSSFEAGVYAQYLAIGNDDDWPDVKPLKSQVVTKGEDRFLIVECPGSTVNWMEPRY